MKTFQKSTTHNMPIVSQVKISIFLQRLTDLFSLSLYIREEGIEKVLRLFGRSSSSG